MSDRTEKRARELAISILGNDPQWYAEGSLGALLAEDAVSMAATKIDHFVAVRLADRPQPEAARAALRSSELLPGPYDMVRLDTTDKIGITPEAAKDARELAEEIYAWYENSLGRHPDGNDDPSIGAAAKIERFVAARVSELAQAYNRIAQENLELRDRLAARLSEPEAVRSRMWDAFEAGYIQGHNDTVESCVRDSKEAACEYFESRPLATSRPSEPSAEDKK